MEIACIILLSLFLSFFVFFFIWGIVKIKQKKLSKERLKFFLLIIFILLAYVSCTLFCIFKLLQNIYLSTLFFKIAIIFVYLGLMHTFILMIKTKNDKDKSDKILLIFFRIFTIVFFAMFTIITILSL